MNKTVVRVFDYEGKRVYITGTVISKSEGQMRVAFPAFVEVADDFVSLDTIFEKGRELGKKKSV